MDPVLVVSAIRAAVRLGNVSAEAIGQYARDREVLLPAVRTIRLPDDVTLRAHFKTNIVEVTEDLKEYWDSFKDPKGTPHPCARDALSAAYAKWSIKNAGTIPESIDGATGYWMIKQWGTDRPIGPAAKVILTMADVALEFAARDPSLLGLQGRGEAVVKALASQIAHLIPDNLDELGSPNHLGATLTGLFLRGALQALASNPGLVVEEEHMKKLVENSLPILIKELDKAGKLDQYTLRNLVETLTGPIAEVAIKVAAEYPSSFFGNKFGNDTLLGVLTRTYLLKVAEAGTRKALTKSSAIELWKATLALAAKQPNLFLDDPESNSERFISSLFSALATALDKCAPTFGEELVTRLAATALDTMSKDIGLLVGGSKPWDEVATKILPTVLLALQDALERGDKGALKRLVSGDMLTEFVRIVLSQAARTPGMLIDTENEELKRIVGAVAKLMADDDSLLLSNNDWLFIAAAVAEEAAANPERLFGFRDGENRTDVVVPLIKSLITVAANQWRTYGRAKGAVLFGNTLREAIVIVVRAASGNTISALKNNVALEKLANQIGEIVLQNTGKFGSKEWLRLYRTLVPRVLETGSVGELDASAFEAILKGANS